MIRWTAVLATAWLTTGCATLLGDPDTFTPEEIDAAATELAALPRLPEAEAALSAAVERIAATATALVPDLRWNPDGERSQGPCQGPYRPAGGEIVALAVLRGDREIPGALWIEFQAAARDVAASVGADGVRRGFHEPPRYYAGFTGDDAATWHSQTSIRIDSEPGSTTITAHLGCRLP